LGRVRRLAPEPLPDATGEPGIIGPPWPFYPRRESGWYRTSPRTAAREWLQPAGNIVRHENVPVIPGSTGFSTTVTTQLPPGAGQSLEPMFLNNDKARCSPTSGASRASWPGRSEPVYGSVSLSFREVTPPFLASQRTPGAHRVGGQRGCREAPFLPPPSEPDWNLSNSSGSPVPGSLEEFGHGHVAFHIMQRVEAGLGRPLIP
jgi:hypothetical protein